MASEQMDIVSQETSELTYIQVTEDETEEAVGLPCETDNSILLSTVASQFPGACGLKYRNPSTNTLRALRLVEDRFLAPENGWSAYNTYYCVFPKGDRRKLDDDDEDDDDVQSKKNQRECSDLIVLGLPWKTSDDELKLYFEKFGAVEMAQVKKDPKTGQSKGFGFIRYADYDTQMKVIAKRHNIEGRWCDVRIPLSSGDTTTSQNSEFNKRIFVGGITDKFTTDDLKTYFSKFGEVSDVFIPRPFRAFAFVTFQDSDVAQQLCGADHTINGVSVHISSAVPKVDYNASNAGNYGPAGGRQGYHRPQFYNNRYGSYNNNNNSNSNFDHHRRGGNQGIQGYSSTYPGNNNNNQPVWSNTYNNSGHYY